MYHVFKKTRLYEGRAYCGPSSDGIPAECKTLDEAITLVNKLTKRNFVGYKTKREIDV